MVNAVLAEDSSSASVNFGASMAECLQDFPCQNFSGTDAAEVDFVVKSVEWVSEDVAKITTSENSSFFVRLYYCKIVGTGMITEGAVFSGEQAGDLLKAGECFAAEQAAVRYLARCEQAERCLFYKLIKKKFSADAIKEAFQYLKEKSYLSNARFARAWLRNRHITQFEGKNRLQNELLSRGIDRETAANAVDEFLSEIPEDELLIRAVEKCKKLGKFGNDAVKYLLNKGFSYAHIKQKVAKV